MTLASERSVWSEVVGQPAAVRTLAEAVDDAAGLLDRVTAPAGRLGRMTNFWLVTGPPGSGRSVIARAFAAGLQCPDRGCGACESCREVLAGTHPDVELFAPEKLQITVDEIAGLLHRSSMTPMLGRWNVLVVEDADRLNEHAANALLKSLEEPGARTVWVLCVPTVEDLLPTIASRSRHVRLTTPTNAEVAASLVQRGGVDPALASFAARAAQGHIGRAAALARHEDVRLRRAEVLRIPSSLTDLPSCFVAAANLLEAATADAASLSDPIDRREVELLGRADATVSGPMAARVRRGAAAALKELEARQKSRRTRMVRDQVDRALLDLTGLYRDVLVIQVEAGVELINAEMHPALEALAAHGSVSGTLAGIDALAEARLAISVSVAPLLALEALMVKLAGAGRR